jgi:hypothetical protein
VDNTTQFFKSHKWEVLSLKSTHDKLFKLGSTVEERVKAFYATHKPARRVLLLMAKVKDTEKFKLQVPAVRELMLALWNAPENNRGAYFRVFVGNRTAKVGLSLLHTEEAIILDEPADEIMSTQARKRVIRYCATKAFPLKDWGTFLKKNFCVSLV